jgi:hypothetical protein
MDQDGHCDEADERNGDDRQIIEQGVPDDLPGCALFSHDEVFSPGSGRSREYPCFQERLQ